MKRTHSNSGGPPIKADKMSASGIDSSTRLPIETRASVYMAPSYPQTEFAKPCEIGHFSVDGNRTILVNDASNLRRLALPADCDRVNFDLSQGYKQWVQRDDLNVKEYIDPILKWILDFVLPNPANCGVTSLKEALHNADFVSFRGLLSKLAATPYDNKDGWIIAAIRYRGVIFLCEFDTQSRVEQRQHLLQDKDSRDRLMTYWGYKFEHYVTKDATHMRDTPPDTSSSINTNEEYCSMVRSKLACRTSGPGPPKDPIRLVFGAEVDCTHHSTIRTGEKPSYVELKTSRLWDNPRQEGNFYRFKALKWWIQSYLIGIPSIVCGFRNDDGIVRKLRNFSIANLASEAAKLDRSWQPNALLNFLHTILAQIQVQIAEGEPKSNPSTNTSSPKSKTALDNPKTPEEIRDELVIFKAEWDPNCKGIQFKEVVNEDERKTFQFIPLWFVTAVEKRFELEVKV